MPEEQIAHDVSASAMPLFNQHTVVEKTPRVHILKKIKTTSRICKSILTQCDGEVIYG